MKKIFILTLIFPFLAVAEEVTPFPAGRTSATDTRDNTACDPSKSLGSTTDARATPDGTGPLACSALKVSGGPTSVKLRSRPTNASTAVSKPGSNTGGPSTTTDVKKGQ